MTVANPSPSVGLLPTAPSKRSGDAVTTPLLGLPDLPPALRRLHCGPEHQAGL